MKWVLLPFRISVDAKCEQKIKDAKEYAMQSEYADASEYMKYVYVDD